MSEKRKKTDSILLRARGKIISVEIFPSEEWPEQNVAPGLFRVKINDVWHCPVGKYSFLTLVAIGELTARLMVGEDPPVEEEAPFLPYKAEVRVSSDEALPGSRAWVHAEPHQERDGRWYVWVWLPGGPRKLPVADVTLYKVR